MIINERMLELDMNKYRLSKESGVPQATVNDICSGKADLEKCKAGTLYNIGKVLGITIEDMFASKNEDKRCNFENFKSNVCHHVKDMGDIEFIIQLLENDEIRTLYNKGWYPEAFYLLAMLDYLSHENDVELCTRYNDMRCQRLNKTIYPVGVILTDYVTGNKESSTKAYNEAIPEFKRFNIIESQVRNIV